jgi:hypothetical protein
MAAGLAQPSMCACWCAGSKFLSSATAGHLVVSPHALSVMQGCRSLWLARPGPPIQPPHGKFKTRPTPSASSYPIDVELKERREPQADLSEFHEVKQERSLMNRVVSLWIAV